LFPEVGPVTCPFAAKLRRTQPALCEQLRWQRPLPQQSASKMQQKPGAACGLPRFGNHWAVRCVGAMMGPERASQD